MYMVVAFNERGTAVCDAVQTGTGLGAQDASCIARDLREEHPGSIVAILPSLLPPDWVRDRYAFTQRLARDELSRGGVMDLIRYVLMRHYHWTWDQVAEIPDYLLIAVLDA